MKIRGLKFPIFIASRPNKLRPWIDLIYAGRYKAGSKNIAIIFALSLSGYGKANLTSMGQNKSKSYFGHRDRFDPNELHISLKRLAIEGIFIKSDGIIDRLNSWEKNPHRGIS